MQRRRFNKQAPLTQRLQEHAKRLRDEARGRPQVSNATTLSDAPDRQRLPRM